MRIAILGATSQIAKDLIKSMSEAGNHELYLYARRPAVVERPASGRAHGSIRHIGDYTSFSTDLEFDALINFVGVGNPAAAAQMGADIFDITLQFDQLALSYVRARPQCRYIFMSSGAAYGSDFVKPADRYTPAMVPINRFMPQNWYGAAKLHAECRHRAYRDLPIIDVRIFNYFSASQDLNARFLICDIVRSIRDRTTLRTSAENIVRDYLHPSDFYRLIEAALNSSPTNNAVDSYSRSPIDKFTLLNRMKDEFGLNFELVELRTGVNSTGTKPNYYSLNTQASELGYEPKFSSTEGVFMESSILFHQKIR
jgi:nucleoside-diphosphate-sugar epimerase